MQPALNNINTIQYTDKSRYVMSLSSEEYPILIFHGATGNGKSMLSTLKFITRVFNSPKDKQTYILAGKDIIALEKRFIEDNRSVLNWYPFRGTWSYKKQGIGGATIRLKTRTGEKRIYLTPFNNSASYSRILGQTIDGVFVDEAVESDDMFLQEIVARINRTKGSWGIFTSNGGDPQHYFYTGMINKSMRIEELMDGVIETPEEEIRYYDDKDRYENFLTVHMALEDNPVYDKEQLAMFYRMYPVGSFMYNSRIMGVRGFTQNQPFSPFMTRDRFIKIDELRDKGFYPDNITFVVDVGGHVFDKDSIRVTNSIFGGMSSEYNKDDFGTGRGGHTVMLAIGWSHNYSKGVVLDTFFPNYMEEQRNVEKIWERVYNISIRFPRVRKPYMFVDNASPSMLSALMRSRTGVQRVTGAIKRDSSIGLDEKAAIAMVQQYMMNYDIMYLDTPENNLYFWDSMVQANLESDGRLVDNKSWEADIQDSLLYSFTSVYRLLLRRDI